MSLETVMDAYLYSASRNMRTDSSLMIQDKWPVNRLPHNQASFHHKKCEDQVLENCQYNQIRTKQVTYKQPKYRKGIHRTYNSSH